LLGKDSIVISYDTVRGEPRGKLRRKAKVENQRPLTIEDLVRPEGDCIDCGLCVQVCPTGIDIRNGTQLECVNCTACIDACDTVMEKIDKPTGLIRYASYNEIVSGKKFRFTPRLMAYTAVLVLLLGVLGSLLIQRSPIQSTILRVPGALFQEAKDGQITNIYQIHVTNNLFEDKTVSLRLKDIQGTITIASGSLTAEASSTTSGVFVVSIPATALQQMKTNITMEVIVDGEVIQTKSTTFIGPM
jgi:cytochrome c oxidase accessory protein FixG